MAQSDQMLVDTNASPCKEATVHTQTAPIPLCFITLHVLNTHNPSTFPHFVLQHNTARYCQLTRGETHHKNETTGRVKSGLGSRCSNTYKTACSKLSRP